MRLAGLWRAAGDGRRMWARLMLTTLGRGGDGQRVRDEILHIMHRNHLKETSGCFVEEWHQKLHNNTTPDDIVICQAYVAFLRSGGDRNSFYRTLEQGGVTRRGCRVSRGRSRANPTITPTARTHSSPSSRISSASSKRSTRAPIWKPPSAPLVAGWTAACNSGSTRFSRCGGGSRP